MRSLVLSVALIGALATSSSALQGKSNSAPPQEGDEVAYSVEGLQINGCACWVPCPCNFSADATGDQCQAVLGWKVSKGSYGKTKLDGLTYAAALTKSGKNITHVGGRG